MEVLHRHGLDSNCSVATSIGTVDSYRLLNSHNSIMVFSSFRSSVLSAGLSIAACSGLTRTSVRIKCVLGKRFPSTDTMQLIGYESGGLKGPLERKILWGNSIILEPSNFRMETRAYANSILGTAENTRSSEKYQEQGVAWGIRHLATSLFLHQKKKAAEHWR